MGTNGRYGSPSERAELRRQRDAMIKPANRQRVRHVWVDVEAGARYDDPPAPGVVVKWALNRRNNVWYARVVVLTDQETTMDKWFMYTRLAPVLPVR